MVMDHLKSCYTTQMRISLNPEIIATVRWYFCPPGAIVPQVDSAFGSMVWENLDHEFPDPGLGEVNLTRTWDPGVAPPGVTGQGTPTPLDWFDDGVPAGVVGPLAPCPGRLPAGPLLWWRPEELLALPVGSSLTTWPHAPTTAWDGDVGASPPAPLTIQQDGPTGWRAPSWVADGTKITSYTLLSASAMPHYTASLPGLGDFTAYWVVRPTAGTRWTSIVGNYVPTTFPYLNATNEFLRYSGSAVTVTAAISLTLGVLHVLSVTRAGSTVTLRLDGTTLLSATADTAAFTPGQWAVDATALPATTGTTWMPEIVVWPRCLGTAELAVVDSYFTAKYAANPYVDYSDMLIGQIVWDSGADAIPAKFLLSDGSPVSRVTYALLFARVGVVYGPGDGVNTFNLPNLKDRCAVGSYGSYATGASGGEATHTLVAAEVPAVPIVVHDPTHTHGPASGGNFEVDSTAANVMSGSDYQLGDSFTGSTTAVATGVTASQPTAGGGPHNNLQPYLALRPLIYAGV